MTAAELFRRHLSLFGRTDAAESAEIYAAEASMDFPYAPQHHTQRLEGRDAILRFLTRVGEFFDNIQIGEPTIHITNDPNVVVAEYPGSAVSKETKLPYTQNYVSVVTVRNGQIVHIREYYNPVRVLVATGEIEEPGA